MSEDSIEKIIDDMEMVYFQIFGGWPPIAPEGIEEEYYLQVLKDHIEKRKALDYSFDWYNRLPPGAMA